MTGGSWIPLLPAVLLLLVPPELQEPRIYEAPWAPDSPSIDGDLSDPVWSRAPWSEAFLDIRGGTWPAPELDTRVKILWDDSHIYVGALLEEPHVWATLAERDAIVYQEDDFEIFLDPDGDGHDYFEIEINALGTILDLFLDHPYRKGGRADLSWNLPGLITGIRVQGTLNDPSDEDVGWSLEMAIPWRELAAPPGDAHTHGSPPIPGDEWRVNFSRVDWPLEVVDEDPSGHMVYRKALDSSPDTPHPESNWVWSPQGAIDMHRPEHWGVLRFLEPDTVHTPPPSGSP